jgi:hypothetical protein
MRDEDACATAAAECRVDAAHLVVGKTPSAALALPTRAPLLHPARVMTLTNSPEKMQRD